MSLTQDQINEVCNFQSSLSTDDEWLFFHLAWVTGNTDVITYEDKYEVMQDWDRRLK